MGWGGMMEGMRQRCRFGAQHVTIGTCCKRVTSRAAKDEEQESCVQDRYMYVDGVTGLFPREGYLHVPDVCSLDRRGRPRPTTSPTVK
jgi:hypothetical protein